MPFRAHLWRVSAPQHTPCSNRQRGGSLRIRRSKSSMRSGRRLLATSRRRCRRAGWTGICVPLEASDRLYAVRRFQVEEAALALAVARQSSGGGDGGAAEPQGQCTGGQLWVETADKRVGGFIDLVYTAAEDLVVRDYKTGVVTDLDEETGELAIKAAYQEQLKIYAALYQATHGQWPTRLEVVTPATCMRSRAIPVECAALLAACDSALDDLAELIGAAESEVDAQRALAKPAPDTCRGCSFRPYCVPYLEAAPGTGEGGWPLDVWGALSEAVDAGDGTVAVTVAEAGGGRVPRRGWKTARAGIPLSKTLRLAARSASLGSAAVRGPRAL